MTEEKLTQTFSIGTLVYTRTGLAMLFVWLLWADFCSTLLQHVVPSILPLQLKALEAPNWVIGAITTTLPMVLTTVISPFVGYKSDRLRTRWGRRIPFLLVTTPFVALFLALLAVSPEISEWIRSFLLRWKAVSPTSAAIWGIAIFLAGFRFFEIINYLVFTYLINDVVPKSHLTRFFSLFRIVNLLGSALYNVFIFQFADTHAREIFLIAAAIYFVGFLLLSFKVKEGDYPSVADDSREKKGFFSTVKTYFRECFSHRIYINYFLHTAFWNASGAANIFLVFLNLSLGLSLAQHGQILGISQIFTCLLLYPAGSFVDRVHPVRVMVWVKLGLLLTHIPALIWLFVTFSPTTNFYVQAAITFIGIPLTILYSVAFNPMMMQLLPNSRFGQFSSALFMIMSFLGIFSSVAVGYFFDLLRQWLPEETWGTDFCYRFIPVWYLLFASIGFVFLYLVYRDWLRLGGKVGYRPPGFD